MKKIIITIALLLSLSGTFIACGGGGGGGGASYAGVWKIFISRTYDPCGIDSDSIAAGTHTINVNQDDKKVVVNWESAAFTGETTDEDGFEVYYRSEPSGNCSGAQVIIFQNASSGTADVGYGIAITCGSTTCTIGYNGTGTRTSSKAISFDLYNKNYTESTPSDLLELQGIICSEGASLSGSESGNPNLEDLALNAAYEALTEK